MTGAGRRVAAAIGVAALAGGLLAVLARTGGAPGTLSGLLYGAGGAVGLLLAYRALRGWIPEPPIEVPDVEGAIPQSVPGTAFDRTLARFDGSGRGLPREVNSIHGRLADLAVAILARRGDYTTEAARDAVRDGRWPEDSVVAAYLSSQVVGVPRSWRDRVTGLFGDDGPSDYQQVVRRTVDLLARESGITDGDVDLSASEIDLDPGAETDSGAHTIQWNPDAGPAKSGPNTEAHGRFLTERWNAVVPLGLATVGFALFFQRPALAFGGVVVLCFVVFARAFAPPAVEPRIERSIHPTEPTPGDEVEVTVTVHNEGDQFVPDLRVVDGVPGGLAVDDGSPRMGTVLRSGGSRSFSYTVTARRGRHEFGPVLVVARDPAHAVGHRDRLPVDPDADTALTCVPSLRSLPVTLPLYTQPGDYFGRIPAGGGEGVEFHSTREYRPGDTTTRIDWNRFARSPADDLTTVRFREEREATVALVVDAYAGAYLAPAPDRPSAVERSIEAAGRLSGSLLEAGDRVGLAALCPSPTWLEPGVGREQEHRIERLLAADPAFPPTPPADEYHPWWPRELHRRFPEETQVVLLTPLCTDRPRFVVNKLRSYGHPVTVISPNPTVRHTVGQRLAGLERHVRIERLRESGVRVLDWDVDSNLAIALSGAAHRWSR